MISFDIIGYHLGYHGISFRISFDIILDSKSNVLTLLLQRTLIKQYFNLLSQLVTFFYYKLPYLQ